MPGPGRCAECSREEGEGQLTGWRLWAKVWKLGHTRHAWGGMLGDREQLRSAKFVTWTRGSQSSSHLRGSLPLPRGLPFLPFWASQQECLAWPSCCSSSIERSGAGSGKWMELTESRPQTTFLQPRSHSHTWGQQPGDSLRGPLKRYFPERTCVLPLTHPPAYASTKCVPSAIPET